MATARQIEANRRNAAGPHQMSETGKQAIRGNAARIHEVLPGEKQSFYVEILESLKTEYAPATGKRPNCEHLTAAGTCEIKFELLQLRTWPENDLCPAPYFCKKKFPTINPSIPEE